MNIESNLTSEITISTVDFESVKPIWAKYLWPQRKSPIEAFSAIKLGGGKSMKYAESKVYFWAAQCADQIVAVISGFATENEEFRMRGLFVLPEFRGRGLALRLSEVLFAQARSLNCRSVWTLPRESNLSYYQSVGFEQVSDFTNEFEFGPNCYALKKL